MGQTERMCVALLTVVLVVVAGCGGSPGGEGDPGEGGDIALEPGFAVNTNPTDPLFAEETTEAGRRVQWYGSRDARGMPDQVEYVCVETESRDEFVTIDLDPQGRPTRMEAPNGVVFTLDWLSHSQAAITGVTDDGMHELHTAFDLSEPVEVINARELAAIVGPPEPREGKATLELEPFRLAPIETPVVVDQAQTPSNVLTIYLEQCGVPDPDNLTVNVRVLATETVLHLKVWKGKTLGIYRATRIDAGHYTVTIPSDDVPHINVRDACIAAGKEVGLTCTVFSANPAFPAYFCGAVGVAAGASVVGAPLAPQIVAACFASVTALEVLCNTVGWSPPGGMSHLEYLCHELDFNYNIADKVDIWVLPVHPWTDRRRMIRRPGLGPYQSVRIDMGDGTYVRSLRLNPGAPRAKEGYVAKTEAICVPAGGRISVKVEGTDGYKDTLMLPIAETYPALTVKLAVPGARRRGIKDTITTVIEPPDGDAFTKVANLVFQ